LSTADGTSVWFSYLVSFTDPTVATHGTGSQWDGIKFTGGDLWFGNNAASANWGMELPALSSSTPMTTGTHLVVAQIEYAAGVQNKFMWIDPSVASLNGANLAQSDALLSQLGQAKSSGIHLNMAFTKAGVVDELRVATNYADVTPIPEPASILLLVSGLVGAYKLRRRS
jgi:hypothetical protein